MFFFADRLHTIGLQIYKKEEDYASSSIKFFFYIFILSRTHLGWVPTRDGLISYFSISFFPSSISSAPLRISLIPLWMRQSL